MESAKIQEKVGGRLEKVLRYYWDGVPVPLLCTEGKVRSRTFLFRRLAFTPDYYGETVELPLLQTQENQLFKSLCDYVDSPQSASCRIGSHYSPHVGLFRFDEGKRPRDAFAEEDMAVVRVPTVCCEKSDEGTSSVFMGHCRIRTAKMVSLYKPLIKENFPLSRHSLRNILMFSSRGCTSISKEFVAREICDVKEEYAEAESEAIFYYMCLNPLFRQILAPLQLATEPPPMIRSLQSVECHKAQILRESFSAAKERLESQLFWSPLTHNYFVALTSLWETKFSRLRFLDLNFAVACIDVVDFLNQLSRSMSAVVSRIRVDLYACVEDLFFSHFKTAREVVLLSEEEYEESVFRKVFLATEVFLVNQMRSLFLDALDRLVEFFDCNGVGNRVRISQRARQLPSLRVKLVSETFQPRAPSFSRLLLGIADLLVDLEKNVNSFPRLFCTFFRTLNVSNEKLHVLSHVELASYRALIMKILGGSSVVIDQTLSSYSKFSKIPAHNLALAKTGTPAAFAELVLTARRNLTDIRHASRDVLFHRRLEINCCPLRLELVQHWEEYLSALVLGFQSTIVSIINRAKEKSRVILDMLKKTPSTAQELERYLHNTEAAKVLADELCETSHRQIAEKVSCIESLFIPVEGHVCRAVFEFKRLPGELRSQAGKSAEVRAKCAPILKRKLEDLHNVICDYYCTLSTGVKELYEMFDLDTCDIAAQTCTELRKLVVRIAETRRRFNYEMGVLNLPPNDSFDEHLPLMNHFEIIEQFWATLLESTKLRELYLTPVSSVNANAFVERAREWRRLIHSSIRNLRAYPALVRIGREQESALAKFEELELFLELITTPGLRKSHWRDIAKLVSLQLPDDIMLVTNMSVTVRRLIDAGLLDHIVPLAQIVVQARCDYEVESELEEMRSSAKRTHFVLENSAGPNDWNPRLAQESRRNILHQIEGYVLKCCEMRRRANLGQSVQKSVDDWIVACQKSHDVLVAWDKVATQWVQLRPCLSSLRNAVTEGICSSDEAGIITRTLSAASVASKGLCTVLRKSQCSLYTVMVQETIQEVLLTIKSEAEDAAEVLKGVMERRRALFPRFRFLPDSELMRFQSVQGGHSLAHVLQYLYPRITNIEVVDGMVTAVLATDGARLSLSPPLALTKDTPDAWIQRFDRAVRVSLVTEVKACVEAYHQSSLESWLQQWCGQVTVLALRILHTEGLRRALELSGLNGLTSYMTKVSDLCGAISRLLRGGYNKDARSGQRHSYEAVLAAALAYEDFALREVQLAAKWHVTTVTELEFTGVVQTFLTGAEDGLNVRVMGVSFDYGLEFLGHGNTPVMSAAQWVQVAPMLVDMELSHSVSTVRAGDDVGAGGEVLEAAALLLGRFLFRVEDTEHVPVETLQGLLRGCVEIGALACLVNCETVPKSVLELVVLPIATASVEQCRSPVWQLPYGGKGVTAAVSVHPLFRLAFCTTAPVALPRSLELICREVRVAPFDIEEALHDSLTWTGVVPEGPLCSEEAEFVKLYRHLQELHPTIFTLGRLRVVLRETFASADGPDGAETPNIRRSPRGLVLRLLTALRSVSGVFFTSTEGEAVRRSLVTQIEAKLLLPSCNGVAPQGWCDPPVQWTVNRPAASALLEQFTLWMNVHRRVLLLGPQFAGKTRLWRSWAGPQLPLVFSLSLISAADFYGSSSEPSFLSLITSQMKAPLNEGDIPIVVMEDIGAVSSFALFLGSWWDKAHVLEGEPHSGNSVFPSPLMRVIGTAQKVPHATPGAINRFSVMALPGPSSWEEGISHVLGSMPDAEWAAKVIEKLLPPLVERASRASPEIVRMTNDLTSMYAMAQRAAALCSRWHAYALTLRTHRGPLELQEDEDEVPLRLFAVRCAVMATVWSVGLSLPAKDRDVLKLLLLGAEVGVAQALGTGELSGDIFPPLLQSDVSPLEQIVLPHGWMSFEEAATRTDLPLSWSTYHHTNPHLCAYSQIFATPSRVATLRAAECLINCGQHVFFHAGPVDGKTTLLHTMKSNKVNWVTQVFSVNGGMQPTHIQQTIADQLVQRWDGRHGPSMGRRLVVCIDDVHLSPVVVHAGDTELNTASASIACRLMRFCEKFQAISTPRIGTMPIANVVFCCSALLQRGVPNRGTNGALGVCVDVRLPEFDSHEIACGVHLMCNLASSRKRTKGFPEGCAAFLDLLHGAYIQLKSPSASLESCTAALSSKLAGRSASVIPCVPLSSPLDLTSEHEMVAGGGQHTNIVSFYTEHLRDALQAAEVVRMHLLSNASDAQVATRVFLDVTGFYEKKSRVSPSQEAMDCSALSLFSQRQLKEEVGHDTNDVPPTLRSSAVKAAEGTMRDCIRGCVSFKDLVRQLPIIPPPDTVTEGDESFLADCIAELDYSFLDEREEDLATLEVKRGAVAGASIKGGPKRSETRSSSVVIVYSDYLRKAAVQSDGPHKDVMARRSSSVVALSGNSSLHGSLVMPPGPPSFFSVVTAAHQQHLQRMRQSVPVLETPTYQTTWLTTRHIFLTDTLSAPHAQVVLLGENTFGLRRLFRLWSASTHIPFVWFRVHPSASRAEAIATFRHELRVAITFICMNSIHAVLYLPPELLRLPEVLLAVDLLVRSGDVSSLFSDEERNSLMRGFHVTNPRSLKPFSLLDDTGLRDRVRSCFNCIFHLRDAVELERMAAAYPFLGQYNTSVLTLYTDALETSLVRELVLSLLRTNSNADRDSDVDGIPKLDDRDTDYDGGEGSKGDGVGEDERPLNLSRRVVCEALCAIFAHVSQRYPTSLAQLVEFVSLYRDLSSVARMQVLESARTGAIIMGRGDEAMQMVKCGVQRTRAIGDELVALQTLIASLTDRLAAEETQERTRSQAASAFHDKLQQKEEALAQKRSTLADAQQKVEERLERAIRHLRRSKVNLMRSLAVSRVPEKGILLVRSLYAVLCEDLPKSSDNPHELWSTAMKRVCTKEFIMALIRIPPVSDAALISTYLPLRQGLDGVRYAPALPYAQQLADFVVAWVDCGKFRTEDYVTSADAISKMEKKVAEGHELYAFHQGSVHSAQRTIAQTNAEIEGARRSIEALRREQQQSAATEVRLMKYTELVDGFLRFLAAPAADVAERAQFARCATADTFLVSAFYALFAMHDKALDMYVSLQQLLVEKVNRRLHSTIPQAAFSYMFYQIHVPRTRALMLPESKHFSWEYGALFMALFKRVAWRWTLIGAATPLIEQELCKYLSHSCKGCVVVSVTDDSSAKEKLIAAMRAGEGVLLRDFHGSAFLDIIRRLNPLYAKLKEHWKAETCPKTRPPTPSASGPADEEEAPVKFISLMLEGSEVKVHPSFYMVCTSSLPVPVEAHGVCDALNVYNLYSPMPRRPYYKCLLRDAVCTASVSSKMCSLREEAVTRQQGYFSLLHDFIHAHDTTASLLAADVDIIRDEVRGDALVAKADRTLADIEVYEGQLSQTVLHLQSWQKMVQGAWDAVLPALEAVANFSELIEVRKLQRPWNASALDGCLKEIVRFPPLFTRRFAPQTFSDLALPLKRYYAVVNYTRCVVEQLSDGWPVEVKDIFSLLLLTSAMAAAPVVFSAKITAPVLTAEQTRVLQVLISDGLFGISDTAATKQGSRLARSSGSLFSSADDAAVDLHQKILGLYATSEDALLRQVARKGSFRSNEENEMGSGDQASVGKNQFYVSQLFSSMADLRVEQANCYSAFLYSTFMDSVVGVQGVVGAPKPPETPPIPDGDIAGRRVCISSVSTSQLTVHLPQEFDMRSVSSDNKRPAAEEVVPRSVFSVKVRMRQAAKAHQPLCLITDSALTEALSWLHHEATEAGFSFVWRELTLSKATTAFYVGATLLSSKKEPRSVGIEEAGKTIFSLAKQSQMAAKGSGMCLALVVDAEDERDVSEGDVRMFGQECQQLLSLYSASFRSSDGSNAGGVFCLTVICSPVTERVLWRGALAGYLTPCCYVPLSTVTPQQRLVELLQPSRRYFTIGGAVQIFETILQNVDVELDHRKNAGAGTKVSANKTTRVRGPALTRLRASQSTAKASMTLAALPRSTSSAALTVLRKAMEDLVSCARLVHHEMVVSHVVSTLRERMRCEVDTLRSHVDDPAALVQLHDLLSAWVLRCYEELIANLHKLPGDKIESTTRDKAPGGENNMETGSASFKDDLGLSLPSQSLLQPDPVGSKTLPYALKAYYYLRRRQPAWQILVERHCQATGHISTESSFLGTIATEERFTHAVLSIASNSKMCGAPSSHTCVSHDNSISGPLASSLADSLTRVDGSRPCSTQRGLVELAVQQWRTGLFVMARQFAFFFMHCRQRNRKLPVIEQQAQWIMLRALVGTPEQANEVPCLWRQSPEGYGGEAGWRSLILDAHHLDQFSQEVGMYPSDLTELCGDEAVARRFRCMRLQRLFELCFPAAGSAAENKSEAAYTTIEVPGRSPSFTLQGDLGQLQGTRGEQADDLNSPRLVEGVFSEWDRPPPRLSTTYLSSSLSAAEELPQASSTHLARHTPATVTSPRTQVYLPALRHPVLDLELLTAVVRCPAQSNSEVTADARPAHATSREDKPFVDSPRVEGGEGGEGGDYYFVDDGDHDSGALSRIILVVTQRRYILPSDVVLSGARLSVSLEKQLEAHTHCLVGQVDNKRHEKLSAVVVVARRVLVRPRAKDMECWSRGGEASPQPANYEVGMWMWTTSSLQGTVQSSLQLMWWAVPWSHLPTDAFLWDTTTSCRSAETPVVRALSSISEHPRRRGDFSGSVFVTEMDESAEVATSRQLDLDAPRAWGVTEVPIPVRWHPFSDNSRGALGGKGAVMLELYLCVEYEPLGAHNSRFGAEHSNTSPFSPPLGATSSACASRAAPWEWSTLHLPDTLDAYIWIE
ncbi:hypothetical protein JKF63_06413 [Porcisia hertigi]|uniref:Dynein heavy chain linker domain-containing protein n=1 Tax=Porcisia hertigi TaxID=2761500 RepID=A0A836LJW0_9TRYP|nr:hypothetical protein JKF63_06413 [Porcisia hertigi]